MLTLSRTGNRYVARLSIDKKKIVKDAGLLWDNESKQWSTSNTKIAFRLIDYADPLTEVHILKELNLFAPDASRFEFITWPKNQRPFDHQVAGAEHILSRQASYLAFAPRVGKSVSSILAYNADPGKTLIICPAFLKLNWKDEFNKWCVTTPHIQIVKNQKDIIENSSEVIIFPDSLLMSEALRKQLAYFNYKLIVVDEAHRYKSVEAKRTKSLLGGKLGAYNFQGLHKYAERIVCLSGTPMPNRPIELHPVVAKHAPHAIDFLNRHEFAVKYCDAFLSEWGWDYSGSSNKEELNEKLNRYYMLTKSFNECNDIPASLPPDFIFLDKENESLRKEQKKMLASIKIEDLIKLACLEDDNFKNKVIRNSKSEQQVQLNAFQYMSELRMMCGVSKAQGCSKIISEMLDEGPLVVFAWHKEVIQTLAFELNKFNPFVVTGSTPHELRHKYKNEFQSSKDRNLFIANIQAAGVGIDLSKSARVVFVEPSWVPGDNDQAIMRCAYLGQQRPVEPYFIVYENSFDHLILNALHFKEKNIDIIINNQNRRDENG